MQKKFDISGFSLIEVNMAVFVLKMVLADIEQCTHFFADHSDVGTVVRIEPADADHRMRHEGTQPFVDEGVNVVTGVLHDVLQPLSWGKPMTAHRMTGE